MRQELERLLDTHRAQRPEMQPQDYYKLLYQREFGCGHTAPAPETAERHLMEEYARAAGLPGADAVPEHVKGAALPGCVEDIGNGLCRIYLNGVWSREALRLLGRVFCATAREHKGETACFAAALDGLAHWADAVLPPRDAQTLRRQTGTLRAAGCPAVHHSAAYREQYAPHYRVVRRCYADAWPALLLAQRVLESVSPGGHALHPSLRGHYTASVFVTCAQAVQRARLTARGGADSWAVFEARWIPLEETYFKAHAVQALADLTLDTTPFA